MRHKNSPINLTKPKFRISVYQDTIKREGHLQPKEKKTIKDITLLNIMGKWQQYKEKAAKTYISTSQGETQNGQ